MALQKPGRTSLAPEQVIVEAIVGAMHEAKPVDLRRIINPPETRGI
jgi:hypothetical protein